VPLFVEQDESQAIRIKRAIAEPVVYGPVVDFASAEVGIALCAFPSERNESFTWAHKPEILQLAEYVLDQILVLCLRRRTTSGVPIPQ
jgi:hypothetical protein